MKKLVFFFLLITFQLSSQEKIQEVLKKFNTESIPYITADSLHTLSGAILLDARERKEFQVSHLKNALFVGYQKFDVKKTAKMLPDKNATIVVYCTLGVRSEDIAEKLKKAGYTNVLNLFGGILEWKNHDYKVYDAKEKATEKVHVCTKYWGQWLKKGEKIYE
jgi:rhodanese-related sulfurtransferase